VAKYGVAKRNGGVLDVCVEAGLVTAAFLRAGDQARYEQWKQTEKADCVEAGLGR
jgi:hypothetical protein